MVKVEASVIIDRRVEAVWNFITDLSNTPKWDSESPRLIELKQISAEPLGVAATPQSKRPPITYLTQVAEYEPNRRFTLDYISGPLKGSKYSFIMENIEGKTRLSVMGDMKLSAFYKLLGPFVAREAKAKREFSGLVGNVKRILESEAHS